MTLDFKPKPMPESDLQSQYLHMEYNYYALNQQKITHGSKKQVTYKKVLITIMAGMLEIKNNLKFPKQFRQTLGDDEMILLWYDLNFKKVIDPLKKQKQEKHSRFLKTDEKGLTKQEEFEQTSQFRIDKYTTILQTLITTNQQYFLIDREDLMKFSMQKEEKLRKMEERKLKEAR